MKKKKFIPSKYLNAIKDIYRKQSGTVTYVNRYIRYNNLSKEVVKTSQTVANIGEQAFFTLNAKGQLIRKTPYEIFEMLDTTRQDLGASYMLIN